MRKNCNLDVQFCGFHLGTEHEIGLLLERGKISVQEAAEELLDSGPGKHSALILKHLGLSLLHCGQYRAVFVALHGTAVQSGTTLPKFPVHDYLFARNTPAEQVACFYNNLIPEQAVALRICRLAHTGKPDIFSQLRIKIMQAVDGEIPVENLPSEMIRYWQYYFHIVLNAEILGPDAFSDPLTDYGLSFDCPKAHMTVGEYCTIA